MTTVIVSTCVCGSLSKETVLCPDHHRYFREGREFASVSRVLRSVWPVKPDYSKAPADVLENARLRGVEVDALFSAYVAGALKRIPAGTRADAVKLFMRLREWWDETHADHAASSQVILADDDIAGTCDVIIGGGVWDLKATYDVDDSYPLQVGMYGLLYAAMYGRPPDALGIIHVTERYATPKVISLPVEETMRDAALIRDTWRMAQRRIG